MATDTKVVTAADVAQLLSNVEEARQLYDEAESRCNQAHRDKTERLNHLNAATKAVDAALATFRAQLPREADWLRSEQERHNPALRS